MTKTTLTSMMEWIRPAGIGGVIFAAYYFGADAASRFHIMGPGIAALMCGTVAFEALFLGEAASEKIGYGVHRAYQIQSGLANAALAVTAVLVFLLGWGRFADATIVTAMLLFFTLSAANHTATFVVSGNRKPINLLRPLLTLLLLGLLVPLMITALRQ